MLKQEWIKEHDRLLNLIRKGTLPRWRLARGKDEKLERAGKRNKLTWRQADTIFSIIGKKPEELDLSNISAT